jgi:large repetitive protein
MKKLNIILHPKTLLMKWQNLLMPCFSLFIFSIGKNANAQGPYPKTGDQIVCLNSSQPYGVALNTGSTYLWTITPQTGGNGTITQGATPNLISVNWTSVGTAKLEVVETNANGCTGDPVSIIITVAPIPTVTVNSSAICAGTIATITAAPGAAGTYNYAWTVPAGATDPGNVASFNSSVAGTYSVIITNTATGCSSASASGTVTINAAPNLVINNPSVCGTAIADLTAPSITTGSTAGLTFTYWTDAAATIPYTTPTAAPVGTYYIKGSLAAGCFAIQPVTVSANTAPTLIVNNPAPICSASTVDLTAASITAGSSAGLTFTYWTNALATIPYGTPTTAAIGTYYIKGTTAGGCFTIKPVVITTSPAPTPVITGPDPVCLSVNGSTSTYDVINTAGHSYAWTVTGGTIASGQNTNSISVTWTTIGTGTLNVTETITATGCAGNAVKTVTINAKPVTSAITHN